MKKISLADLSKEELLYLISSRAMFFRIDTRDIIRAKAELMSKKGLALMDQACLDMVKYKSPENYTRYKKEMDKFDKGVALVDAADKLLEQAKK